MTEKSDENGSRQMLLVVAVALTEQAGRVLVQRRPAGKALAGLWEFPGGKVEVGETPEAALIRELAEELGIVVKSGDLTPLTFTSHPLADRTLLLLLYRCTHWLGEPQPLDADGFQWCRPDEMAELAMPPADLPLVAFLNAELPLNHRPA